MFVKIPFESEIEFKTNISEITKMSLEHEFNVNSGVVLGNFYISGEYKAHEVSVNKEPFKYTLPFTVELRDDIDYESVEFNIEDFSYSIVDNNKLKVNIEYSLTGEIKEDKSNDELFERVNEDELESEMAFIDDFLDKEESEKENEIQEDKEKTDEKIEEESKDEEKIQESIKKDKREDEEKEDKEEVKEEIVEERVSKEDEKTIMETIKDSDDTFVTYHIHIVKENETMDSICQLYGTNSSIINEYNNVDTLNAGDKILIPKADE